VSALAEEQSFAVRLLGTHIKANRLSTTYLISGTRGTDKEAVARTFARALNCESGKIFEDCACGSCRKIEGMIHPDVKRLGHDPKVKSIKIEEVRQLKNWMSLKPYEGRCKVAVIAGADRLTAESQNALLKSLEEPPANTVLCLLVENKAHLFETIRSRAFEVRLQSRETSLKAREEESPAALEFGKKDWIDFFEASQTAAREDVKDILDQCLGRAGEFLRSMPPDERPAWVQAVERIAEAKEALEDNVNQKLTLTRLAMRLRQVLPLKRKIS